jgi:hypothetical protein
MELLLFLKGFHDDNVAVNFLWFLSANSRNLLRILSYIYPFSRKKTPARQLTGQVFPDVMK